MCGQLMTSPVVKSAGQLFPQRFGFTDAIEGIAQASLDQLVDAPALAASDSISPWERTSPRHRLASGRSCWAYGEAGSGLIVVPQRVA